TTLDDHKSENQASTTNPSVITPEQLPSAEQRNDEADRHAKQCQWDPLTWFNGVLAVCTGLLVIVGGAQVWLICQSARTTRALKRPWIVVRPEGMHGWTLTPTQFPIRIDLEWSMKN